MVSIGQKISHPNSSVLYLLKAAQDFLGYPKNIVILKDNAGLYIRVAGIDDKKTRPIDYGPRATIQFQIPREPSGQYNLELNGSKYYLVPINDKAENHHNPRPTSFSTSLT